MASTLPIMPSCAPEPGAWFTPLPISAGFATMLMLLSAHVEAERDLEHADLWDMALMGWLSEAEKTRLALVAALDALSGSEVRRVEDLPLKRMALLIRKRSQNSTVSLA